MNKKWIIWSWALVLLGIAGVVGAHLLKTHQQRETALYKQQSEKHSDDYFGMYDDKGRVKSKEQLKLQQQTRLRADLADLGDGTKTAPVFAEVLYGDNWRQAVSEYRNKMLLINYLLWASVAGAGAGIIAGLIFLLRWIIGAFKSRSTRPSDGRNNEAPALDDGQAEAEIVTADSWETTSAKPEPQTKTKPQNMPKTALSGDMTGYFSRRREKNLADSLGLKESLGQKANNYLKDASKFGASAMLMSTEPANNTLDELTQEVSAIREFAAQQQDRVKQLQEGYDWTIIKRFCLRIIRCIDNLDDRISSLESQDKNEVIGLLEDVRDELVFALESSGVEQFKPEINAQYKGLEKIAEAVREKEHADKAGMSGKIAKVVRAGYRYVLNDDDVKTVRAAQVKLYG
ncbi:MAG: nucleotide exchange factor GrpE [Planctomycetota bacterium]|jgi:molecular chaperone GrpE (heat shock protein)